MRYGQIQALFLSLSLFSCNLSPKPRIPVTGGNDQNSPQSVKLIDAQANDALGFIVLNESDYTGQTTTKVTDQTPSGETVILQYTVAGQPRQNEGVLALSEVKVCGQVVSSCDGKVECLEAGLFNPNAVRGSIAFKPTEIMLSESCAGMEPLTLRLVASDRQIRQPSQPLMDKLTAVRASVRDNRSSPTQALTCQGGVALGTQSTSQFSYHDASCSLVPFTCQAAGGTAVFQKVPNSNVSCQVLGDSLTPSGTLNQAFVLKDCDESGCVTQVPVTSQEITRPSFVTLNCSLEYQTGERRIKADGSGPEEIFPAAPAQVTSCVSEETVSSYAADGTIGQIPAKTCAGLNDPCEDARRVLTHTFTEPSFASATDCAETSVSVKRDLSGAVTLDSPASPVVSCDQTVQRFSEAAKTISATANFGACDTATYHITNQITGGIVDEPSISGGHAACVITRAAGYLSAVGNIESPCVGKQVLAESQTLANPQNPSASFTPAASASCVDDLAAPTVSFQSIAPTSPGISQTPSLTITTSEASSQSGLRLFSDVTCATAISAAVTATSGDNVVTTSTLTANSPTTIHAKMTDVAGNASACTSMISYTHQSAVVTPIAVEAFPDTTNYPAVSWTPSVKFSIDQTDSVGLFNAPTGGAAISTQAPATAGVNNLVANQVSTVGLSATIYAQPSSSLSRTNMGSYTTRLPPSFSVPGLAGNLSPIVSDTVSDGCSQAPGCMIVAGTITAAGARAINSVARIKPDGSIEPIGPGFNSSVNSLAIDASTGALYAAGNFTCAFGSTSSGVYPNNTCSGAGGTTVYNRVAKWNGSSWSALGTGTNNNINALAFDPSGNLYAGGNFTTAGAMVRPYLAKWLPIFGAWY